MSSSDETTAGGMPAGWGEWNSRGDTERLMDALFDRVDPMRNPAGVQAAWDVIQSAYRGGVAEAEAENARLRERVAELEGALVLHAMPLADGLPCWCAGGWLEDGRHGAACLQSRAALAQADDGGRA